MSDSASTGVHSVQLAIDVLEAVAFSDDELGVTQIADRLGMTKGSVHRHLQTLVDRGYLAQNSSTSRYSIGRGPVARPTCAGCGSDPARGRTDAAVA